MNTASIRIQLMSSTKTIQQSNSKCYLQIIPNVTNLENIDKIEWKSGKDTIEYILPINYKIIVKKVEPDDIGQSNKIYYSCVDLLHTPVNSENNVELGSGDISRIVSDNAFVQKFTNMLEETNKKFYTSSKNCLKQKHTEEKHEYSKEVPTVVLEICNKKKLRGKSFIYLRDNIIAEDNKTLKENLSFAAKKTSASIKIEISKEDLKASKDKEIVINQVHAFEANIKNPKSVETLTNLNARFEIGSELTVTSIISEWKTNITPLLKTVYQNTSSCNIQKQTLVVTERCTAKELTNEFQQNTKNCKDNIITRESNSQSYSDPFKPRFNSKFKVISALRLSSYIQLMEKEMLPLRIALNEIINKCTPLCLFKSQEKLYRQNQLPSNRGVYSVVFNK